MAFFILGIIPARPPGNLSSPNLVFIHMRKPLIGVPIRHMQKTAGSIFTHGTGVFNPFLIIGGNKFLRP